MTSVCRVFPYAQMRVRDALFSCLAEKWKRDAKRRGERVLSDAHGLRMVVYYWSLNLNLKRSAKNSFENKIRIWNLCSVFLVHLSTPKPARITPLN